MGSVLDPFWPRLRFLLAPFWKPKSGQVPKPAQVTVRSLENQRKPRKAKKGREAPVQHPLTQDPRFLTQNLCTEMWTSTTDVVPLPNLGQSVVYVCCLWVGSGFRCFNKFAIGFFGLHLFYLGFLLFGLSKKRRRRRSFPLLHLRFLSLSLGFTRFDCFSLAFLFFSCVFR